MTCEPEVHANALNPVPPTSEYTAVIFDNEVDFCGNELHYLTVIPPDHNKPICIAKLEQGEAPLLLLSDVGDGVFDVQIKVLAWGGTARDHNRAPGRIQD